MQICINAKDAALFRKMTIAYNDNGLVLDFDSNEDTTGSAPLVCSATPPLSPMKDLNRISWKEIEAIGASGNAREHFALGAQKKDYMKNGFVAVYQIIGFDHDDLADGSGKAPISWDLVGLYKDSHEMNETNTNRGGWDSCGMNKWLNEYVILMCSDDLQSVIKPVIKLTGEGGCSKEIVKSVCKLWLKSEIELFGRTTYTVHGEGHWYELYRQEDTPYYREDEDGDKRWYWLRSPIASISTHFYSVHGSGSSSYNVASLSYGVCFGFSC